MKSRIDLRIGFLKLFIPVSLLFAACSNDESEPKYPENIKIEAKHQIFGEVFDFENKPLAGVTVVVEDPKLTTTSDEKGQFVFSDLSRVGIYSLSLTKEGANPTKISAIVRGGEDVSGVSHVQVQMVKRGVTKNINAQGGVIKLPSDMTTTKLGVDFVIPNAAIESNQSISTTSINNVTSTQATDASASLMVLDFKPSGLEFKKDCEIRVVPQSSGYNIKNLKLFLFKDSKWVEQPQSVEQGSDGSYKTTVKHFSMYKIGAANSISSSTSGTVSLDVSGVDNLNGKAPLLVTDIPYSYNSGYEYTTSVSSAVSAVGITGADAVSLSQMLEDMVKTDNNGMSAGVVSKSAKNVINVTLPVGLAMSVKGVQNTESKSYSLDLDVNGVTKIVTVSILRYGQASLEITTYNKKHEGGSAGN